MKRDCDLCTRPLIPKKAYEKLDQLAKDGQLIICSGCRVDNEQVKVVASAGGASLVEQF